MAFTMGVATKKDSVELFLIEKHRTDWTDFLKNGKKPDGGYWHNGNIWFKKWKEKAAV
jgi:hypothetical protein